MDTRTPSLSPDAEALLSQSDWVRALVRGLGVDENGADDILQSTWLAALSSPPRATGEGASLRAWIARVARNFAMKRIDRDERRVSLERGTAREERLPSTADVVEREEARAQVVRALLDLHEPFRTTLLLRFYEELEPRDIARLQKVPDSTVRNRLRRGLGLLRERLESTQGPGWRQRCLLVLPALRPGASGGVHGPGRLTRWRAAKWMTGGALVGKKIAVVAAAAIAATGLFLAWSWDGWGGSSHPSSEPRGAATLAEVPGDPVATERAAGGLSQPVSVEANTSRKPASAAADPNASTDDGLRCKLRGHLLGPDGAALKPRQNPFVVSFGLGSSRVPVNVVLDGTALDPTPIQLDGTQVKPILPVQLTIRLAVEGLKSAPDERPAPDSGDPLVELQAEEAKIQAEVTTRLFQRALGFVHGEESALSPAARGHVVIASAGGDARELEVDDEGGFEFGDLRPDRWHLYAEAPGCQARRVDFEIAPVEREKTLDVSLLPAPWLRVKLITPEERDLREAVGDDPVLGLAFAPVPFATRERPGPRIPDLNVDPGKRYAAGLWRDRSELDAKIVGDASGILELAEALPLHVGVAVRGTVLDERLVPPGAEEVVFVIPLDRIRALPVAVAVRVVSAQDGLPVPDAQVEIEGIDSTTTDSRGAAAFGRIPPGRRKIHFEAEGFEQRQEWIDVEPGAPADLGVRELGRATTIAGKVVDENGAPVQTSVELRALDANMPGAELPLVTTAETDETGRFVFDRAGRRRYLLCVRGGDWAGPPQTVDARDGHVADVVLQAGSCGELKLTFPVEPPPGAEYLVETTEGVQVALLPCEGWRPLAVRLGNGDYRALLMDGARVLWARHVRIQPGMMIAFDEPGFGR